MVSAWGCPGPFLVVVPLSTMPHWEKELARGRDIRTLMLSGSAAERREVLHSALSGSISRNWNLLLVTYETMLSESRKLHSVEWCEVIFDEAQRLKNPRSKSFLAAAALSTDHRLLLSGTPLQNSVNELWALLHLLAPSAFLDEEAFCNRFGSLDTARQAAALSEVIRPYLLRRTKTDVETSLSRLTERLIYVEFTTFQKAIYRAVCEKNRALLIGDESSLQKKSALSFRNLEMLLRHVCNHPYLVAGVEEEAEQQVGGYLSNAAELDALVAASGKTVLLAKLLPHLHVQGHRVLIFSQFKDVLNLLEDILDHLDLAYERLDGDINGEARQAAISRFEAPGSTIPVFLLGTRAGGLGITLTSADTVIVYDPDWNPQADLQAAARCHRIGQQKPVTVYRLVTRGTYEMALYARANQKRGLEQAVIGHGDFSGRSSASSRAGRRSLGASDSEIERLLRLGAHVLAHGPSADAESERFAASSIEELLATHSVAIERDDQPNERGTFSQATFISETAADVPDLDDPDFWHKVLPNAMEGANMQAQSIAQVGRTLRARSNSTDQVSAHLEAESDSSEDSVGAEDDIEEASATISRKWRPAETRVLLAVLLRGGPVRFHHFVGAALPGRTVDEINDAIRALISLWRHSQPENAHHLAVHEQTGGNAENVAVPTEAELDANDGSDPFARFPVGFVRRQSTVKNSARSLRILRFLAALTQHRQAGRTVRSLRLRKRKVLDGWTSEHDDALIEALWHYGLPSLGRSVIDSSCWRAIADHLLTKSPPLQSLEGLLKELDVGCRSPVHAERKDESSLEYMDDTPHALAICAALNKRATQLCQAMIAYDGDCKRDLQKEAEAREKRLKELEERRRLREAAERAKVAAREQKAAERAAQIAAKAAAALEREKLREARRAEKEAEQAKTAEQRREEKRAKELERVTMLLEQGKKVWAESREVQDLAGQRKYPPVPPTTAGKPQERNRSCHLCTQGVASWRGAFTAPLGCSKCPRIFCERCLGHINDEALLPLAGRSLKDYFDVHWENWTCLMCSGLCACQNETLCSKIQIASVAIVPFGTCRVRTQTDHPFHTGDSVTISGIKPSEPSAAPVKGKGGNGDASKEALARLNKQHGKVVRNGPREFEVSLDTTSLPSLAKGTGRAVLPTIELHKRRGWVGVTGSGVSKKPLPCAARSNGETANAVKSTRVTTSKTCRTETVTSSNRTQTNLSGAQRRGAQSRRIESERSKIPAKRQKVTPKEASAKSAATALPKERVLEYFPAKKHERCAHSQQQIQRGARRAASSRVPGIAMDTA
eukprot:scaffold229827_cov30-Tisochrysis_lutea.AAC.1